MPSVRTLLGALPDSSLLPQALPTQAQGSLRGLAPVLVALVVLVAGLVVWAVFLRQSPRTRRRGALVDGEVSGGRMSSSGRRRRRRRRERRPMNPTRAEAGGLPPTGSGGADPT
ncbi:MAG: hypothetical protein J0L84_13130, partial [Verrucomicrobia bacterium]|nr:hypothetical protein [Verrucomicrobiota bacterium]